MMFDQARRGLINRISELAALGLYASQIGDRLGVTKSVVHGLCRRNRIPLRNPPGSGQDMRRPTDPLGNVVKAPLKNRVRFMCERMGWLDGSIAKRAGMTAEEVKAFRQLHGIVHRSERPGVAEERRERRWRREAAKHDAEHEMMVQRARRAADMWSPLLAGRIYEDARIARR